jgi:hypothetical protein
LVAGVDWLLVPGTQELSGLVEAVAQSVTMEHLSSARLREAARAVRTLAGDIG